MKFISSLIRWRLLASGMAFVFLITGCATTKVISKNQTDPLQHLKKPKQILVYDFAVSPDEVRLDSGIGSRLKELAEKTPRTEQERVIGQRVAQALSKHLLAQIQALGIPAVRATTNSIENSETLLVQGQLFSIEEGNRTRRLVIGLGMGSTEVRTMTQVYGIIHGEKELLDQFNVQAKSGRKPGMAETMGAGAAAGHLVTSAVVSSGLAVGSEAFGDSVDADAARAAKVIARQLRSLYRAEGWIK